MLNYQRVVGAQNVISTVEQYGDDNNPRTGNPVLNQAVFHGMIEGWLFHSAQYFTLVMVMLKNGEDGPEPSRYGNCFSL